MHAAHTFTHMGSEARCLCAIGHAHVNTVHGEASVAGSFGPAGNEEGPFRSETMNTHVHAIAMCRHSEV